MIQAIQEYRELFVLIVTIIVGLLGMPLTNWLKAQLGVDGKQALILTALVAGLLAVSELMLTGALVPGEITVANFPGVFGLVFATATIYYKLFSGEAEDEPIPPQ